jgi:two-component system response regulator (stage 0 sporulation protein F)
MLVMPTLLVVDDDPAMRSLATDILADEGYLVVTAPSGEAGLRLLRDLQPALIITDVRLPGMNGVAFCQSVQANPQTATIPLVVWSAGSESAIERQCRYSAFLTKPFDIDTLIQLVARYSR